MLRPRSKGPLAELPLALFLPAPDTKIPPSPVSLPTKRGPPTPRGEDPTSPKTPKRRIRDIEHATPLNLDSDELGTGRSPARRLFTDTPPANKPSTSSKLAPSPPLSSTRTPTLDNARPIHDVGFKIMEDDGPFRPAKSAPSFAADCDTENIPPPVTCTPPASVLDTPRRNKAFERSRLGMKSISASDKAE